VIGGKPPCTKWYNAVVTADLEDFAPWSNLGSFYRTNNSPSYSPCWAGWIKFTVSHSASFTLTLLLSSQLLAFFFVASSPQGFPTKFLYPLLVRNIGLCVTWHVCLILFDLIIIKCTDRDPMLPVISKEMYMKLNKCIWFDYRSTRLKSGEEKTLWNFPGRNYHHLFPILLKQIQIYSSVSFSEIFSIYSRMSARPTSWATS